MQNPKAIRRDDCAFCFGGCWDEADTKVNFLDFYCGDVGCWMF